MVLIYSVSSRRRYRAVVIAAQEEGLAQEEQDELVKNLQDHKIFRDVIMDAQVRRQL